MIPKLLPTLRKTLLSEKKQIENRIRWQYTTDLSGIQDEFKRKEA